MRKIKSLLLLLPLLFLLACEENLSIVVPEGEELLVVEGHIEQDQPPIVVLMRSVPLFSNYNDNELENSYVHDAEVLVKSGDRQVLLQELPSEAFSPALRQAVATQFMVPLEKLAYGSGFKFFVYTSEELKGEIGKSYQLTIRHQGKTLHASTTIPQLNPLTALVYVPHPEPLNDSLVTLMYRYNDPDTLGNSIRYFTKRNGEQFYPGYLTSVFNDELINGARNLSFPLERGRQRGNILNSEIGGYFMKGDTVTVRWAAIDLAHYRFWSSLEAEQSSNGSPIASPNTIRSNIKGGLGIWGGYGITYHTIVVPE